MPYTISAVIATRNSEKTLGQCLSSLSGKVDQLIVIDGQSKDKTVEIARQFETEVYFERNKGFFGAYNMGFEKTISDYVMFLDSDAYLKNFDFQKALSFFEDPEIGLVICLAQAPVSNWISKLMNDIWSWRKTQLFKYTTFTEMRWLDRQYSKFFMSKELHSGATTTGPCYILRRSTIEKMGGLDAKGDDFSLGRMLERIGYQVRFFDSDSVFHYPRTSLIKLFREYSHFGLRGAQIERNFFTRKERSVGIFMFCLSMATAPFIAKNFRDPRHLLLIPVIRSMQACGLIIGSLFLEEKPEKNYN